MPRKFPPWQGAQRDGQGHYKERAQTGQLFIQIQGSSDQIVAVKTDENEISCHYSTLCLSTDGGAKVCGMCTGARFGPQRPKSGSFAGLRPDGSTVEP